MLKTTLTELLGIKHPIIQAGMGPFSNNNLCVATSNAGILGLLSTSGLFSKGDQTQIYEAFVQTAEASKSPGVFLGAPDDLATVPWELIQYEVDGIRAVVTGDREKALMAAGECAQRVEDLPMVQDLVDRIMHEATEIIRNMPKNLVAP